MNRKIFSLGILLIAISIAKLMYVLLVETSEPHPLYNFFWFCNFAALVLGSACLFASESTLRKVSTLVLVTAVPAQGLWIFAYIIDLLNIYTFNRILPLSSMLLDPNLANVLGYSLSFVEHVILVPVALYLTLRLGFEKNFLLPVYVAVVLLLTFSFFISPDVLNLNCMKRGCDTTVHNMSPYIFTYDYYYFGKELLFWMMCVTISYKSFQRLL
jgi:hypothetical protein